MRFTTEHPNEVFVMPRLTIRKVGMSYLVSGLNGSGLDVDQLRRQMAAAYGIALGVMGEVARSGKKNPVAGLIVDRKAESWEEFLRRLSEWIGDQVGSVHVSEEPGKMEATLQFESPDGR